MLIIQPAQKVRRSRRYNPGMTDDHVQVEREGGVARVWLNRPELRNAFNPLVIRDLSSQFTELSADDTVRVVVLGGRGDVFCAGADLGWMKEMSGYSESENLDDARRLAHMLRTLNSCTKPVVCRVQKAAFGGALGLMACCDCVVATDDSRFAFSEVRLGISPATIAPYVVAKTGAGFARDVMLSG
ncbi:MAG TPA: hypothetical protein ENO21_01885, partial [Firmicutes bacterium]|nr:hypothetical protein [Bacillota bacterium]